MWSSCMTSVAECNQVYIYLTTVLYLRYWKILIVLPLSTFLLYTSNLLHLYNSYFSD